MANDVMIVSIGVRPSSATITPPSGWTLVRRVDNPNAFTNSLAVYRKSAGSSEPASYGWSLSGADFTVGGIQSFSGVDPVNPIDVESGQLTGYSLSHATPSVTTTVANAMLVTFHTFTTATTWSPPAGMTEGFDVANTSFPVDGGQSIEGNWGTQAAAGATEAKTATAAGGSSTQDWGNAAILALRPGAPPEPKLHFIHTDHLNTPRLITNDVGQPVWTWNNDDPFGANVPNENPSALGNFTCNLRLPGQYFDKETNLHYNYFRDYGPAEGRYVQSDPIGLAGGINTYAYVESNPLRNIDPYGLQAAPPGGGAVAGGATGGAAGSGGILGGASGSSGNVGSTSAIAKGLQKLANQLFCPPECEQLQAEIAELASELRVRYVHMTADVHNLYCTRPVGQFSWMGHQLQFNVKQKRLQNLISQAKAKNCPISPEDERLANTPPPSCPAR